MTHQQQRTINKTETSRKFLFFSHFIFGYFIFYNSSFSQAFVYFTFRLFLRLKYSSFPFSDSSISSNFLHFLFLIPFNYCIFFFFSLAWIPFNHWIFVSSYKRSKIKKRWGNIASTMQVLLSNVETPKQSESMNVPCHCYLFYIVNLRFLLSNFIRRHNIVRSSHSFVAKCMCQEAASTSDHSRRKEQ